MSKKHWTRLTAILITTALGTTVASTATASPLFPTEIGRAIENQSLNGLNDREDSLTKIRTHEWNNHPAATLFVRDIPVLTFLDLNSTELTVNASENSKSLNANSPSPQNNSVSRASRVAERINQLYNNSLDANTITVRWQDNQAYSIQVGEEELVTVESETILPDTTQNLEEDARQATNRLRRLLGSAPPLPEVAGKPEPQPPAQVAQVQNIVRSNPLRVLQGMASWYGPGFHGRQSASGERFNQNALTAAHRSLPFGTQVRVTNLNNGRSVIVKINDRGPFSGGRIIDLSAGAARVIGMVRSGVAPVKVEVLP